MPDDAWSATNVEEMRSAPAGHGPPDWRLHKSEGSDGSVFGGRCSAPVVVCMGVWACVLYEPKEAEAKEEASSEQLLLCGRCGQAFSFSPAV